MKVGIRFSDNDFMNTTRMFMELFIIPTFVDRGEGHMVIHLTSSQIVELFNRHAVYCFKYMQDNDTREYMRFDEKSLEHYRDWLQITEQDVYWDDKTDPYIEDWNSNNNCEFVWTDGKKAYVT